MSKTLRTKIDDATTAMGRKGFLKFLCYKSGLIGISSIYSACEISSRNEVDRPRPREPILFEYLDERVRIESPLSILPLAYVSNIEKKIFVDYESRISVSVTLAAHISVSSGLWRIPLLGEDVGLPIDAGDPRREFSEHSISEWNPGLLPREGDYRIRRGFAVAKEISLSCVPILPEKGWVSGGPWSFNQCDGISRELCSEVFTSVGKGVKHDSKAYRMCAGTGKVTEFMTWVVPKV